MLRETRKKSPRKESGSRWWKKMSLFSWKTLVPILLVSTLVWIVYGNSQFDVDIKDKVSKKRGLFSTLSTTRFKRLAGMTDRERFRELLTPIMVKRVSGSESIRKVQQHIVGVLKKLDWSIELDEFEADTPYGTKKFVNIVATQDPSKPRRLVLAAHYDSKFFANGEFIGATDSAVPCAMLLDLAESLQDELQNGHPEISLQLIFFDGEEAFKDWTPTDSIYGSRHLAQLMKERKQLKKMDAFVLLDLIGAKRPVFRNFFASTSKLFERLVETEDKLGLHNLLASREGRYFSSSAPWGGGIEDDHIPFLHQGVPILHLISSPFPSVWHTTADDWSALDWPTIDNLTKVFRIFVAEYLHL